MLNNNLFAKYNEALKYLQQQFNALYIATSSLEKDNPIEHLKYRIKTEDSIIQKLNRLKAKSTEVDKELKYSFSEASMDHNLSDIVGVRVVCPFLSDVEKVIRLIHKTKQDMGFEIIEEKDYINNPKKSGYSSYHMKILLMVPVNGNLEPVKAEIQIRTITMDMLASLEHKIRYKKGITVPKEMQIKLAEITRYCNFVEVKLNHILKEVQQEISQNTIECPVSLPDCMDTKEFTLFLSNYTKALDILNDKINKFSLEYRDKTESNPIEHVKSRIKTKERIVEKLSRKNLPITIENIENNIHDIAGIRIVCSFKSDVEEIIRAIKEETLKPDSLLEIIEEQDYNSNPKKSGYTSYHMLVSLPIFNQGKIVNVKVEIQIRTVVQEMWAILQERLCYHKEVDPRIANQLKDISADMIAIDENMNEMIKESIMLQNEKENNQIKKKERKILI